MVKPRVFVSSTFYDLKYIRNSLESFIESIGYEPVLFEDGDVPYDPQSPLDESCYEEVEKCHMLVLIIGGRYGSSSSRGKSAYNDEKIDVCKSITAYEYRSARENDIPIYIAIDKNVYHQYQTSKEKENSKYDIKYFGIEDISVFSFIQEIESQPKNNPIQYFEKPEDISSWLRDQWAGRFADYLKKQRDERLLKTISGQIEKLSNVTETLEKYSDSILKSVNSVDYVKIKNEMEIKNIEDGLKLFYIPALYIIKTVDEFLKNPRGSMKFHEILKYKSPYATLETTYKEYAAMYTVGKLKEIGQYSYKAKEDTRKSFEKYVYEEDNEENYCELSKLIKSDSEYYQDRLNYLRDNVLT